MIKKLLLLPVALLLLCAGCATMQSIVKSTFPYTTDLTIPSSSVPGKQYETISDATSFDQEFSKSGNNGDKVSEVRIVSAKLRSIKPTYFNIGDIISAKIYMCGADSNEEVLVASRTNITADAGNSIVLDIDNSDFLDEFIRKPNIRIKMVYVLRNNTAENTNLRLVLGLAAEPNNWSIWSVYYQYQGI